MVAALAKTLAGNVLIFKEPIDGEFSTKGQRVFGRDKQKSALENNFHAPASQVLTE